jgi:hypothetical protein
MLVGGINLQHIPACAVFGVNTPNLLKGQKKCTRLPPRKNGKTGQPRVKAFKYSNT